MDTVSPFPSDVRMYVAEFVGRWYVVARKTQSLTSTVVMMRPFPTYDEARAFQYSHAAR